MNRETATAELNRRIAASGDAVNAGTRTAAAHAAEVKAAHEQFRTRLSKLPPEPEPLAAMDTFVYATPSARAQLRENIAQALDAYTFRVGQASQLVTNREWSNEQAASEYEAARAEAIALLAQLAEGNTASFNKKPGENAG